MNTKGWYPRSEGDAVEGLGGGEKKKSAVLEILRKGGK